MSHSEVERKAKALAEAVAKIRPHIWERGMAAETEYEEACLELWVALDAYLSAASAKRKRK